MLCVGCTVLNMSEPLGMTNDTEAEGYMTKWDDVEVRRASLVFICHFCPPPCSPNARFAVHAF
jgi:hypothetical protein